MSRPPPPKIVCGPMVRSTGMAWSSLWIELDRAAALMARANQHYPAPRRGARGTRVESAVTWTVEVNRRHYALLWLDDLAPGTLYRYELFAVPLDPRKPGPRDARRFKAAGPAKLDLSTRAYGLGPTLRTFPGVGREDTRIAFGSCRAYDGGNAGGTKYGDDVFEAYASHLATVADGRVNKWPSMLLLLGDQIYADDVTKQVVSAIENGGGRLPRLERLLGAYDHVQRTKEYARRSGRPFDIVAGAGKVQLSQLEHFAMLYVAAWTSADVPRLLANIPTFMAADDHEVTDDWNLSGGWVADADADPAWHDVVVNGMVAFWLYQAWGNHRWVDNDPRMAAMAQAREQRVDAGRSLHEVFDRWFNGDRFVNYFRIASNPPVLVLDTRSDRKHVAPITEGGVTRWADAEDRIVSDDQLAWLRGHLRGDGPFVIASSVPLIQTVWSDTAQALATRSVTELGAQQEMHSQESADIFEFFRRSWDTETISAFPLSWLDFLIAITAVKRVVWLSGDVHFSALHHGPVATASGTCLLTHLVSSGFRHRMSKADFEAVYTTADPLQKILDGLMIKKRFNGAFAATLQNAYENQIRANIAQTTGHVTVQVGGPVGDAIALGEVISRLIPARNETLANGTPAKAIPPFESTRGGMTSDNTVGLVTFYRDRRVVVALGAPAPGTGTFAWRYQEYG